MAFIDEMSFKPGQRATFQASSTRTTLAASATDFWTFTGSASKTIRILEIKYQADDTGSSLVFNTISLIRRSSAGSGGTATTLTAIALDTNNASATGTVKIFTANPTVGSAVGTLRTERNASGSAVTASTPWGVIFDHKVAGQALVLRGTSEQVALNLGGVTQAGTYPKMNVEVTWTEE